MSNIRRHTDLISRASVFSAI